MAVYGITGTIQNMLHTVQKETSTAIQGKGGIQSWLIVGGVVFLIVFFVRKVSK